MDAAPAAAAASAAAAGTAELPPPLPPLMRAVARRLPSLRQSRGALLCTLGLPYETAIGEDSSGEWAGGGRPEDAFASI
eukprot:7017248-Prymnesium_polylepis.1